MPPGLRRSGPVHHLDITAQQVAPQAARLAHRRRGGHDHRVGSVSRADAAESLQDVVEMRAEHAPVDVQLVHNHMAQMREEIAPVLVVAR